MAGDFVSPRWQPEAHDVNQRSSYPLVVERALVSADRHRVRAISQCPSLAFDIQVWRKDSC